MPSALPRPNMLVSPALEAIALSRPNRRRRHSCRTPMSTRKYAGSLEPSSAPTMRCGEPARSPWPADDVYGVHSTWSPTRLVGAPPWRASATRNAVLGRTRTPRAAVTDCAVPYDGVYVRPPACCDTDDSE